MLNKLELLPDEKQRLKFLLALSRLKRDSDFVALVELLEEAQYAIDKTIRTARPPELDWKQGAAQFLSDLLEMIQGSDDQAASLRKQVESKGTPSNAY